MMRTGLLVMAIALSAGVGCSNDDCGTIGSALGEALDAATQCDPAASTPCVGYQTVCDEIGVDPDQIEAVETLRAKYQKAGCEKIAPPCAFQPTPTGFACQPDINGVNVCVGIEP